MGRQRCHWPSGLPPLSACHFTIRQVMRKLSLRHRGVGQRVASSLAASTLRHLTRSALAAAATTLMHCHTLTKSLYQRDQNRSMGVCATKRYKYRSSPLQACIRTACTTERGIMVLYQGALQTDVSLAAVGSRAGRQGCAGALPQQQPCRMPHCAAACSCITSAAALRCSHPAAGAAAGLRSLRGAPGGAKLLSHQDVVRLQQRMGALSACVL